MSEERSVYQEVLGDRFDQLDPRLRLYFGPLPTGTVGEGRGVYDIAGSRRAILRPVLAWMAWRRILFPEFGRSVPFTVVNTRGADGTLSAVRSFSFPRAERIMHDSMSVIDGRLVDRLGKRRGLEVTLDAVIHEGGLRMISSTLRLRLGGIRIPLPRVATVTLDERALPSEPERQHVDVRITSPFLGEIFRYSGSFAYRYISDAVSTRP